MFFFSGTSTFSNVFGFKDILFFCFLVSKDITSLNSTLSLLLKAFVISKNFPNLYKKDINKLFDILLSEIIKALKNGERVELRDVMTFETRIQKERISLNPKTLEKVQVPEKKTILFKCSKEWKKKLNEQK